MFDNPTRISCYFHADTQAQIRAYTQMYYINEARWAAL